MDGVVIETHVVESIGLKFKIFNESRNWVMKRNEAQNQEAEPSPATVILDIKDIVQQLGIDLANWPQELPRINNDNA